MAVENKTVMTYLAIGFLYGSHYHNKTHFDFYAVMFLYFLLVMFYYEESIEHHTTKENFSENRMLMIIALMYVFVGIIYAKHLKSHEDFDYFYISICNLITSAAKYNIYTHNGTRNLSQTQLLNVGISFGISGVFLKHAFIHESIDYLYLFILYLLYAGSDTHGFIVVDF